MFWVYFVRKSVDLFACPNTGHFYMTFLDQIKPCADICSVNLMNYNDSLFKEFKINNFRIV